MAIAELSASHNDTYVGGNFYMMWWEAGDSSHQCGYVIEDDASADDEVIVCSTDGVPCGITALQNDLDIDTAVTSGKMYEYYCLHIGTVLMVPHDEDDAASLKGQAYLRSAADAGMVELGTTAGVVVGYSQKTYDAPVDCYIELVT